MQGEYRIIDDPERWDSFVLQSPQGHFLQSYAWGEFKSRFGWKVKRVALEAGGQLQAGAQLLLRPTPLGAVGYVPRGPIIDANNEALTSDIVRSLHEVARSQGAIFLKVEPNTLLGEALLDLGFHRSTQTIQPKGTIVIDLSLSLDEISARQKSKTRYNIKLASRRGVEVSEGKREDLPVFHEIMKITGSRDEFAIRPLEYYQQLMDICGESMKLLLAGYQGEVLAGLLISIFGREAIYLYGASSNKHRNLMPTYLLQWQAMKLAKEMGCTRYDMWGIPSEAALGSSDGGSETDNSDPAQGLWGVYRFKQGFGGSAESCPGAFDYVYSPPRYRLWTKLVPWAQRLRRKVAR